MTILVSKKLVEQLYICNYLVLRYKNKAVFYKNKYIPPPWTVLNALTSLALLSAPVLSHSTMSDNLLHMATANELKDRQNKLKVLNV